MISLRVKGCFILMGADLILSLFMAAAHDGRFVVWVGLACLMNWLGNTLYRLENTKEETQ